MGKQKKGKSASSKSSKTPYALILGIVAVVAAVAIYFYSSSGGGGSAPTSTLEQELGAQIPSDYLAKHPNLRNRLILPAIPHETRPATLPPESFADDEIRRSYQAAKDHPEVLETVSCYCGCYGSAGHRNNLDCYRDNHGIT